MLRFFALTCEEYFGSSSLCVVAMLNLVQHDNSDLGFNTNPKNGRVKALSKACLDRTYSLDCGLEYVVVPGAGGFTLDFGVNLLLYFNSDAYLSGKLVLSYSF